jgi:4-hydroxy-tetrahydrodipicolinate synthase
MNKNIYKAGVWSAAPTPLTDAMKIDTASIERLVEHHIRLGVKGVFLCGTSGEGPWMTNGMCYEVVHSTIKAANGRLKITVQVTDNSADRILANIATFAASGVDAVIVAPPFFQLNTDQEYLLRLFTKVLDHSPLPVGFYHRGAHAATEVTADTVTKLMEHPNLIMVKDSSSDAIARQKFIEKVATLPEPLQLFNGDEFDAISYLQAGYDGMLFGGACFNGCMSNMILNAAAKGDFEQAQQIQDKMTAMMIKIFGGDSFPYWLAAQKQLLVELGIFATNKTIINYKITPTHLKILQQIIVDYKEYLLP